MANIKVIIDGVLMDGHNVTFKAPCACSGVEYLDVRHIKDRVQVSTLFTMKDSHGNDLTGLGNLFEEGAYVRVVLDTTHNFAYLLNADTNGYLETKFTRRVMGYDTSNTVDLTEYKTMSKLFTVPCDGVIYASVSGDSTKLNGLYINARTYNSDGTTLSNIRIGSVCSGAIGGSALFGTNTFPVYAGQKVYYTLFGDLDKIEFYPYLYC